MTTSSRFLQLVTVFSAFIGLCWAQAPTVTAITPGCASSQSSTPVTISGSNFVSVASASVGGVPLQNLLVLNSNTITGVVPPVAPGQKNVTVCNAQGCGTLTGGFAATPLSPNLLVDGSFESVIPQTYNGGSSIPGWTVLFQGIDVYQGFWQNDDGLISVDINAGATGGFEQAFPTQAGTTYLVTFSMAANTSQGPTVKHVQLSTGTAQTVAAFDGTGFSNANMGWHCKSWTFTANAASTNLRFTSLDTGPCGAAIDNVAVYELTALTGPAIKAIGTALNYSLFLPPATPYILEVSTTGSIPGTTFNGVHIPLNPPFLNLQYGSVLPGIFVNFIGFSNAMGLASATVNVPNLPVLIGTQITAAFGTLDATVPSGIGSVAGPLTTLIVGPAPVIGTIVPATGPTSGGTAVTINGSNFEPGATVRIGGTVVQNAAVTPSFIVCSTPPGPIGPADIRVDNPGGLFAVASGGFTYVAPLVLDSVSPLSAAVGAAITGSGSGIQAGATVSVGSIPASVTSQSPSSITFTLPPGVTCDTSVVVTNPDAQTASKPFNPTPVVNAVTNGSGPAAGGSLFALIGSQFLSGTTVTVGGNPAAISFQSQTFLVCAAPPGAVGPAAVVVSSAGGCTATSTFTYQ